MGSGRRAAGRRTQLAPRQVRESAARHLQETIADVISDQRQEHRRQEQRAGADRLDETPHPAQSGPPDRVTRGTGPARPTVIDWREWSRQHREGEVMTALRALGVSTRLIYPAGKGEHGPRDMSWLNDDAKVTLVGGRL